MECSIFLLISYWERTVTASPDGSTTKTGLLLKWREPCQPFHSLSLLQLKNPSSLLTPNPNQALELLGSDIKPISVGKDIVFPSFNGHDVISPDEFRESDEKTVIRQVRPGTDPPAPSERAVSGFRRMYFAAFVELLVESHSFSFGGGQESDRIEVMWVRVVIFIEVNGPVVPQDCSFCWDVVAIVNVGFSCSMRSTTEDSNRTPAESLLAKRSNIW